MYGGCSSIVRQHVLASSSRRSSRNGSRACGSNGAFQLNPSVVSRTHCVWTSRSTTKDFWSTAVMARIRCATVSRPTTAGRQQSAAVVSRRIFSSSSHHGPRTPPSNRSKSTAATNASHCPSTTTTATTATTTEAKTLHKASKSLLPLHIVSNPAIQGFLPILGNLSYIIVASGFLMTDMVHLRVVLAGGYTGLVAFHALHPRPLKIPLAWSALFIGVNAVAASLLLADRYAPDDFDDPADQVLYEQYFASALPKCQFYQMRQLATIRTVPAGTVLTVEGQTCEAVYFIQSGTAQIFHRNLQTATIHHGGFVNDVAYSQDSTEVGAYGTVVTTEPCRLLVWQQSELRQHLERRPEMDRNMKYLMSEHLVKSLLRQRETAHARAAAARNTEHLTQDGENDDGDHLVVGKVLDMRSRFRRSPTELSVAWNDADGNHESSV